MHTPNKLMAITFATISLYSFGSETQKVETVNISTNRNHESLVERPVLNPTFNYFNVDMGDDARIASKEDFELAIEIQKQVPSKTKQKNVVLFRNDTLNKFDTEAIKKYRMKQLGDRWDIVELPFTMYAKDEKKFALGQALTRYETHKLGALDWAQGLSFNALTVGAVWTILSFIAPEQWKQPMIKAGIALTAIGALSYPTTRCIGEYLPQPYKESVYQSDLTAIEASGTPQEKLAIAQAGTKLLLKQDQFFRKHNNWLTNFAVDLMGLVYTNQTPSTAKRVNRLRTIAAEQKKIIASQTTVTTSNDGSTLKVDF